MSDRTDPIVSTASGPVRGTRRDGIARFLGIPFAQAMTGDARWAAPVPPPPWSAPRDASAFGPTAPGSAEPNPDMLPVVQEPHIPGDGYLNLNVWAPDPAPERPLPVLVWIHGGGYFGGCSANPWYDGTGFATQGLVFVSVNYRLAAEGFARVPGTVSNRAVLDWIAALTWIRENIRAFGGDPGAVTIFGQSAGGFSVANLLGCAPARGLFHRAIICSGISDSSTRSVEAADAAAQRLTEDLGVANTRAGIDTATSDEIVAAQIRLEQARGNGAETPTLEALADGLLSWAPVRDGDLIRDGAVDGDALRISDDVPVLVGNTHDEFGWSYTLKDPDDPRGQALADRFMRYPTQRFVDARQGASAPTYRYEFRWRSRAYDDRIGAAHSLDIPFFFDTLSAPYVEDFTGPNPPQHLADGMHAAFARFAREGEPGWAPHRTESGRVTRVFDDEITTEPFGVADPLPAAGAAAGRTPSETA